MTDNGTFSLLAVLHDLNAREFRKKLDMFPEEVRYHVILAGSIVGSENSKRVKESPDAVTRDSEGFVSRLLDVANPDQDEVFRKVLETYLVATLRDELKFSCMNCRRFPACLDIETLTAGELFRRRVEGDESEDLRKQIAFEVGKALLKTPHVFTDEAWLCKDFAHQYDSANVGAVFGRYADIAATLSNDFGIDYRAVQQEMIAANMSFCDKLGSI